MLEERGGDMIRDTGVSPLGRIVLFRMKVVSKDGDKCLNMLGSEDGGVLA